MNKIEKMENLPESKQQGMLTVFQIPLKITVQEGSFLHIGGSPSPLTEKKAPVFSVDGKPAIPASSFKGAFRYQVEQLLIDTKNELKSKLGVSDDELLNPCIPAPNPSKAEKELLNLGYRQNCGIKVDEEKVEIPMKNNKPIGVCPVCYFFGATGLMGFLHIPNFWPDVGEYRIDQTNIRIDRKSGTAAHGPLRSGDQVKPGTVFKGILEIVAQQGTFQFGRAREIGGTKVDLWLDLDGIVLKPIEESQLLLINEILIPALNNLTVLGGQKSKGAGKVSIELNKSNKLNK